MFVGPTLAFMAVSALGGCGTVENIVSMGPAGEDHLRVYGGVRRDLEVAHDCAAHPENQTNGVPDAVCTATERIALDLPLSAVADTLTLPWTLAVGLGQMKAAPVEMKPEEWHSFWAMEGAGPAKGSTDITPTGQQVKAPAADK
jgi:uncharacterized protein YceK